MSSIWQAAAMAARNLAFYDTTAGKFSDLSNVLPASWCQGIRTMLVR